MKCNTKIYNGCSYRLDVPHFFDKEDQPVAEFYKPVHTHTFTHLMCVRCGDEQQLFISSDYVNQMLGGSILEEEMIGFSTQDKPVNHEILES